MVPRYQDRRFGFDICLVVPAYRRHFGFARELLLRIRERAVDQVPIHLIVTTDEERQQWLALEGRHQLAPHFTLAFEQWLAASNTSASQLLHRSSVLLSGTKKLYALRHVYKVHGCELAWVMDADSLPLRRFSFGEAFSRFGKLMVAGLPASIDRHCRPYFKSTTRMTAMHQPSLYDAAQSVHGLPLSARVRELFVRENDFWLMETRLVAAMMQGSTVHNDVGTYADALMRGAQSHKGALSEQILWLSWLVQRVVDCEHGATPAPRGCLAAARNYSLVGFEPRRLAACGIFPGQPLGGIFSRSRSFAKVDADCVGTMLRDGESNAGVELATASLLTDALSFPCPLSSPLTFCPRSRFLHVQSSARAACTATGSTRYSTPRRASEVLSRQAP